MITSLTEISKIIIASYRKHNPDAPLPNHLVIIRDGVSIGQYAMVRMITTVTCFCLGALRRSARTAKSVSLYRRQLSTETDRNNRSEAT